MTRALLLCLLLALPGCATWEQTMSSDEAAIVIAAALTVLQVFDGWTTYKILRLGGRELNPVVKWLMDRIGEYEALVVFKAAAILLVWVIALNPIDITPFLLTAVALFYGFVAAHNYGVLSRMK